MPPVIKFSLLLLICILSIIGIFCILYIPLQLTNFNPVVTLFECELILIVLFCKIGVLFSIYIVVITDVETILSILNLQLVILTPSVLFIVFFIYIKYNSVAILTLSLIVNIQLSITTLFLLLIYIAFAYNALFNAGLSLIVIFCIVEFEPILINELLSIVELPAVSVNVVLILHSAIRDT